MSAELIGILDAPATLLVGLGGLVLALQTRTDKRFDAVDARLDDVQSQLRRLAERVARSEGLMEGAGLLRVVSRSEAVGD